MHYPIINEVIFSIGPLSVRWYGMAYLVAFLLAWWLGNWRAEHKAADWSRQEVSDLIFYGALGAVLGGRLGYVLVYNFSRFLEDPIWLFKVWDGGMSFHGGLTGVLLVLWWFARHTRRHFLEVGDFVAPLIPLGLGFGRLGNFANTELPGRITDSFFGVYYPCSAPAIQAIDPLCTGTWEAFMRHPSPLYQAFTEGLLLFLLVWFYASRPRPLGAVSGMFLTGYGCFRFVTEFFRQPDEQLGFIAFHWMSMGQLLSLPMVAIGLYLLLRKPSRSKVQPAATEARR